MGDCPITHANFQILIYKNNCGTFPVVKNKCVLIKYNNNYHVSLVENATGDPTLVSNTDFSEAMTASEAIRYIACNCSDCPTNIINVEIDGDVVTMTRGDGTTFTQDISHPSEFVRDNEDGTFTLINADGSDGETWVGGSEFVRDNGDGTFTLVNADGSDGETWVGGSEFVRDNGDGTFTLVNADGSDGETWVGGSESVRDNGDGTFTFINADGSDGDTWVGGSESVRDNGNGTFTFINADGSDGETWVGGLEFVRDNGDGTFTLINADGTVGETWVGGSEFVRDNGDGTFTFINADGSVGETWVGGSEFVRDNGDGTFTFINADGSEGDTWVGGLEFVRDNGDGSLTFINADGTEGSTWVSDIGSESVRDNGDGTFTFINADGSEGVTWCGSCAPPCPDVIVGDIADQAINGGGEITISATADAGTDETIDTWAWTQTGGTAVVLTGDTTSSISFTAPNETTTLTFEVTATNSCGNSATGTATVEATENVGPPPEFATKAYSSIVVASPAPVLVCQQTYGSDEPGADQNLCSGENASIELTVLNDTLSLENVNIEYVSGINLGAGAYVFTYVQYDTNVTTSVFLAPDVTGLSTYRVWGTSDNGTAFDITRTVYLMPTGL